MKNAKFCNFHFELYILADRGFSLLELLAVLLLLGLMSLIVLPSVDRGLKGREVRKSALEVAAVARYLRSRAVYEGALQRLIFNPVENSYQSWGGTKVFLSSDVEITRIAGGEPLGEGRRQFVFFPNGSILGGEVGISSRRGSPSYVVQFEALAGRVEVVGRRRE